MNLQEERQEEEEEDHVTQDNSGHEEKIRTP